MQKVELYIFRVQFVYRDNKKREGATPLNYITEIAPSLSAFISTLPSVISFPSLTAKTALSPITNPFSILLPLSL
nr:MAG TPA: hypothetical protein [Caudoviricetes sp.]